MIIISQKYKKNLPLLYVTVNIHVLSMSVQLLLA